MNMKTSFDFGDGRGEVPAHQHPNGCGWVEDTATVAPTAYVAPTGRVMHRAQVLDASRVEAGGIVQDDATLRDHSKCWGRVGGNTEMHGYNVLKRGQFGFAA